MRNPDMLVRGCWVGAGGFLAKAFVVPLLSDETVRENLREAVFIAALTVALFAVLAVVVPPKKNKAER